MLQSSPFPFSVKRRRRHPSPPFVGTGMNGEIIKPALSVVDLVAHMSKGDGGIAGIMLHHCVRNPHALDIVDVF